MTPEEAKNTICPFLPLDSANKPMMCCGMRCQLWEQVETKPTHGYCGSRKPSSASK